MATYADTVVDTLDAAQAGEYDTTALQGVVRAVIDHHNAHHPGVWQFCREQLCRDVTQATSDR